MKRFVIELDRGVLTAEVAGTGQRIALLRLGAAESVKVGAERIVLRGVDAKLTAQAGRPKRSTRRSTRSCSRVACS